MEFFECVITDDAKRRVQECLDSGFINEGKLVREFEQEIEKQFGYKNCVAVNSCTSALHLALVLAGVGPGDEVILPAQTFVATGLAVLYTGAKPVFADIEKETGNISFLDIHTKINDKTKSIILVSWGGNPCYLGGIKHIPYDISPFNWKFSIIQDNAQALGATYYNKPLTEWGDFSCYSFQATKHLTTGDGGMFCCPDTIAAAEGRLYRWFGISKKANLPDETGERLYNLLNIGYKYNMNDIDAALGLGNLQGFEERLNLRRLVAHTYQDNLPEEILTHWHPGSACWLYTVLVDNRPYLMSELRANGIPCSVVHNGIDRNDIFGGLQDLPNQRYWDEHHLCLPIHSSLTNDDVYKVIEVVNRTQK